MKDSIPVGFVMVKTAFERYLSAFDGVDQDGRAFSMLTAFSKGALQALTTNPDNHGQDEIPSALWNQGAFPDRVFYSDDIAPSDEWQGYVARTPFVSEPALSAWITAQRLSQERTLTRLRGEYWSIDEALHWLLWRDENPDRIEIMVRTIDSLEPGRPRASQSFDGAKAKLVQALRRGDIRSVVTDASNNNVEAVPPEQFASAELQHSAQGHLVKFPLRDGDVGLNGGHLNMPRVLAEDVVRTFPIASASLEAKYRHSQSDRSYVEFDEAETSLSVFRAAQWLALKGQSGSLSLEEVERVAETTLFRALAAGEITAQAIEVSTMLPATVPASRWAMVTTDEAQPGQLLQWINSWWFTRGRGTGEQVGGELTAHEDRVRHGAAAPTWVQLSVDLAGLSSLLDKKPKRPRGAQPGQGAVDDTNEIAQVYELMKSGTTRWKATQFVGAQVGGGDAALTARTAARLWRKTNG